MNWRQRTTDCQRRHAVVYPAFVKARARYQRLDRVCTYWANRGLEAGIEAKKQEGKVTIVPADKTRDDIQRQIERFERAFKEMSAEQQRKLFEGLEEEMNAN